MSVQAITYVLMQSDAEHAQRLVLLSIANHANDECESSCAVSTYCQETKLGERTVQTALRKLAKDGEIEDVGVHPKYRTRVYRMVRWADSRIGTPAESEPDSAPEPKASGLPALPVDSSPTVPTSPPRKRDVIGDALARAELSDPLEVPASRMRTLCVKANELRKLDPSVTPEEVARRAANWGSHFDHASISGPAIVTHWARLAHAGTGNGRAAPRDRAQEIAEQAAEMAIAEQAEAERAAL